MWRLFSHSTHQSVCFITLWEWRPNFSEHRLHKSSAQSQDNSGSDLLSVKEAMRLLWEKQRGCCERNNEVSVKEAMRLVWKKQWGCCERSNEVAVKTQEKTEVINLVNRGPDLALTNKDLNRAGQDIHLCCRSFSKTRAWQDIHLHCRSFSETIGQDIHLYCRSFSKTISSTYRKSAHWWINHHMGP